MNIFIHISKVKCRANYTVCLVTTIILSLINMLIILFSLYPVPDDLTPEEKQELENIRRRKQELLEDIQVRILFTCFKISSAAGSFMYTERSSMLLWCYLHFRSLLVCHSSLVSVLFKDHTIQSFFFFNLFPAPVDTFILIWFCSLCC